MLLQTTILTWCFVQRISACTGGLVNSTDRLSPKWNTSDAINYRSHREQQLIKSLLSNYENSSRPPATYPKDDTEIDLTNPVIVFTSLYILSLSSFNDVTMTFTCQFRLQQEWMDRRLAFNDSYFSSGDFLKLAEDQQIWAPDTFFQNEQFGHEHNIDKKNAYTKIRSDGRVRYSKRLTMGFSCTMNLVLFPHDCQNCVMDLASYAYTENDITYVWDAVPINFSRSALDAMPKFSVESVKSEICSSSTSTGNYSCLRVALKLKRQISFFLLQLYLPSCMMVAVGCVSFWIDWRSAPARVPLAIVTLLTITTQAHGINSALPPVSYTKAIDVWIGACIVFIFGALLEFAIVNYVGTNEEKRKAKWRDVGLSKKDVYSNDTASSEKHSKHNGFLKNSSTAGGHVRNRCAKDRNQVTAPLLEKHHYDKDYDFMDDEARGDCFDAEEYVAYRKKIARIRNRRSTLMLLANSENTGSGGFSAKTCMGKVATATTAERIDMLSRILFPIGFILFNIVYWALYIPLMASNVPGLSCDV